MNILTKDGNVIMASGGAIVAESSPTGDPQVFFIDYDGTEVETWSIEEAFDKSSLPTNPTHDGLIGQGWNWELSDITDYLTDYPEAEVYVGQMYKTASGLTEIDVTMNKVVGNTIILNMVGNKDWGDGTTNSLTTHTYADYGDYTITCDGTSIPAGSSGIGGMFGQHSGNVNNSWCTGIRIGENVVTIQDYSFYNCYSLKNITIPQNVSFIGQLSFYDCYSLKCITVPQQITSLEYMFSAYTTSINYVLIPPGVTNIGECSMQSNSLVGFTLPSVLTTIGQQAFADCYTIKKMTLTKNITSIGSSAFAGNNDIDSITIPQNMTTISDGAFSYMKRVKSIFIHNGVSQIEKSAFSGCYSLSDITIEDGVSFTELKDSAFYQSGIRYIKIPKSVTRIGANVFYSCRSCTTYDFSSSTSIPTLSNTNTFTYINKQAKIIVPIALYNNWIKATNWSSYADYIYFDGELISVKSISITANNVGGRATTTTIHVTATWETDKGVDYTETKDVISDPFPQNTSKTDVIKRIVTGLYREITVSATITQGIWEDASYTLEPVGSYPFNELSTITNPNPSLYDGVYQSTNKGQDSTYSVVKINFVGYDNFTVYIRSYAESSYDYTIASTLDASSYPTAYGDLTAKSHTRSNQQSGTAITNYTKVEYPNDGGEHFIYIVYRKDSSAASGDDRGYFLIEK